MSLHISDYIKAHKQIGVQKVNQVLPNELWVKESVRNITFTNTSSVNKISIKVNDNPIWTFTNSNHVNEIKCELFTGLNVLPISPLMVYCDMVIKVEKDGSEEVGIEMEYIYIELLSELFELFNSYYIDKDIDNIIWIQHGTISVLPSYYKNALPTFGSHKTVMVQGMRQVKISHSDFADDLVTDIVSHKFLAGLYSDINVTTGEYYPKIRDPVDPYFTIESRACVILDVNLQQVGQLKTLVMDKWAGADFEVMYKVDQEATRILQEQDIANQKQRYQERLNQIEHFRDPVEITCSSLGDYYHQIKSS